MSNLGTVVKGLKGPIIRAGDDLAEIVIGCLKETQRAGDIEIKDRDVLAVTEAVVAKAQGNIASFEQVAKDVKGKFGDKTVGIVYPIFSRNRFAYILNAIASGLKEAVVMLNYPFDEVGNPLLDSAEFEKKNVGTDKVYTEEEFRKIFPVLRHPFTGTDYIELYKKQGANIKVMLSNKLESILRYTDNLIVASIHSRRENKRKLLAAGAKKVLCLDEIMTQSVDGSGFNADYGVLGSNISTDNSLKLFPRDCGEFCNKLQKRVKEEFAKNIECMVYGDGAFRDPLHKIWELADPVVSPGYTDGLRGTPNEVKIKYISENQLGALSKEDALREMKRIVQEKTPDSKDSFNAQGTTPRRLTDLLGSLADLTSGSGDKGTPFVLIQNYFGNIATEF